MGVIEFLFQVFHKNWANLSINNVLIIIKIMKHFLLGILLTLIVIVGACVALEWFYTKQIEPVEQPTTVQEPIDLEFQEFNSIAEVTEFHQIFQEKYENERLFVSLPSHTITNIANFLASEKIPITIENIVNEYKKNAQIYDNIIVGTQSSDSTSKIETKDTIPIESTIASDDTIKTSTNISQLRSYDKNCISDTRKRLIDKI